MKPVATYTFTPTAALTKVAQEQDNIHKLRIVGPEACSAETQMLSQKLAPKEIMACMAFHLFGMHFQFANCANARFSRFMTNAPQYIHQIGFDDALNITGKAIKFFREFTKLNKVAVKGEIFTNNVSNYPSELTTGVNDDRVISISKVWDNKEIIITYNTDRAEPKEKFILMHNNTGATNTKVKIVFGYESCGHVHLFHRILNGENISYIKVYLKPMQLVILEN